MWKLPRKKKKAYIAEHGRERYQRAVHVSLLFDPVISMDTNGKHTTIVVAGITNNGTVHILGMERTMEQSNALMEFMRTLPKREYTVITDTDKVEPTCPTLAELIDAHIEQVHDLVLVHALSTPPLPATPPAHVSPLYRKCTGLLVRMRALKEASDSQGVRTLTLELVALIEKEAVRDPESASFILVDRERVHIEDDLLPDIWFKYADRTVEKTDLPDGVRVRTSLFTCDRADDADDVFETLVQGGEHDGYTRRYATWEEAEVGHKETIWKIFEA